MCLAALDLRLTEISLPSPRNPRSWNGGTSGWLDVCFRSLLRCISDAFIGECQTIRVSGVGVNLPVTPLIELEPGQNMRTRPSAIIAFLTTLVFPLCGYTGQLPSFEQIYSSNDKTDLTAWGRRYARGVGVAKDPGKAVKLFCKSARKGDTDAKFELGQMYAFGLGVTRDLDIASAWYYQAAKGESRKAQTMLQILKVKDKPGHEASCPLGIGTRIASRRHPASGEIARMVRSMAPEYELDPNLVLAVIETESGFNPNAVSSKNAQGLMQLIPATASRFGVDDVWDARQNLQGGMAYLRWLLDHFDGDIKLALAGYNAGEKAVERHGGIPPFAETRAYVQRIMERIGDQS